MPGDDFTSEQMVGDQPPDRDPSGLWRDLDRDSLENQVAELWRAKPPPTLADLANGNHSADNHLDEESEGIGLDPLPLVARPPALTGSRAPRFPRDFLSRGIDPRRVEVWIAKLEERQVAADARDALEEILRAAAGRLDYDTLSRLTARREIREIRYHPAGWHLSGGEEYWQRAWDETVYLLDLSSVQDLAAEEVRRRRKAELEQPSVPPLRRARDSAGLIRVLTDLLRPPDVRCEAARALAEVAGEAAIPPLLARLRDPAAQIRACSRASLARIGAPAVPALMKLLHDADPAVRQEAAKALTTMRPPVATPAGSRIAADFNPRIRGIDPTMPQDAELAD